MSPGVIAALVSGGAALLGSVTNNILQNRAIKKQNEYNAPESQVQRFQAAGLSPNLIYGNGSASAGNQSSLGDYQGVKVSTQDALNMANAILQFKNTDANTRKAIADADNAEANATNTRLDTQQKQAFLLQYQDRLAEDLQYKRLQNAYTTGQISLQEYNKQVMLANIRHINSQSAINDWQLSTGLPMSLAISQQNADTAQQNMILSNKRFAFDSSFDQNINPLNYWNSNLREREYHWGPINNISRSVGSFLGGGLAGTLLRGKMLKSVKGGSR